MQAAKEGAIFAPQKSLAEIGMEIKYCRGCGKQLHESAEICPQCGATQYERTEAKKSWPAIISMIFGVLSLFASIDTINSYKNTIFIDQDILIGIIFLSIVSIIFGIGGLTQKLITLSITGIMASAISVLITINLI